MQQRNLQRIAIVNRGEAAVRFIIAVRELNAEHGTHVRTVALYTDPDSRARYVREADEAVCIGPATFVDTDGLRKSSYLDYTRLERALVEAHVDGAWVGWGFVSERSEFADLCARLGVVFIGPAAETLRSLRDKVEAKRLAERAEVPVIPWGGEAVSSLDKARAQAKTLGYPLMLKAAKGRGGRGLRQVRSAVELGAAFEAVQSEARQAFDDGSVMVERLLTDARQVEVQVLADHHGETWTLGLRDCSAQLHRRKTIEEAPAPLLSAEQQDELCAAAKRLCRTVGYRSLGTVEFLYVPQEQRYYFLEFNTRLQAGHAVTEMVTGADLVKLEFHVASGGRLTGEPPKSNGHAIGVRLHAEDPDSGFVPAPGVVERFRMPTGPGLRVDTGLDEGDAVLPELDLEIARVIAHGRTREEALSRIGRALTEGAVVLRGGTSNKGFLLDAIQRPEMIEARGDIGWLERLAVQGERALRRHADVALVHAAIEAYESELAVEKAQFYAAAARGRPEVGSEVGRNVELSYHGNQYLVRVRRLGMQQYHVDADGQRIDVTIEPLGRAEYWVSCGGQRHRVLSVTQGVTNVVEVDGVPHRIQRDRGGYVRAPAPAVVVSMLVKEGDEVSPGDRLAVLEAMKTETAIEATFAGRVRQVLVVNNVQVMPGAPLLLIEPGDEERAAHGSARVLFDGLVSPSSGSGRRLPEELRCLMLGFDADQAGLRQAVADHGTLGRDLPADDADLQRLEDDILTIFVDVASLFRRQAGAAENVGDEARVSTKEYLFSYLRDLGAKGEGLPERFVKRLRRALAHYGVQGLEPTSELAECLYRIYRAHERGGEQLAPIFAVLQRRLDQIDLLQPKAGHSLMVLLDRLIAETQSRYPAINDVAREVRYRYFDQPVLEQAQQQIHEDLTRKLNVLLERPDAPDREQSLDALVDCPHPVAGFIAGKVPDGGAEVRRVMLELLTKRYYRMRQLSDFGSVELADGPVARARYEYQDDQIHVLATYAEGDGLGAAAKALIPLIAEIPSSDDVVVDFNVWKRDLCGDAEKNQAELQRTLSALELPRTLRRIVVTLSCAYGREGGAGMQHFTFRPAEGGGYQEEKLYRGLHPMMGKRLHLSRLSNFKIERLPTRAEDIYLFRGVARENPKDERLFGLAEVRDLTPIRDDAGRVVRLPQLERMLMETLAALRRVQARRSARDRLYWNRVQLFVNPVLDLRSDELNDLVHRLAPATEGLGLENVVVRARVPDRAGGQAKETTLYMSNVLGQGVSVRFRDPPDRPMQPLSEYEQKVVTLRRRGLIYPYELIQMLTPAREGVQTAFPAGEFVEYDLDDQNRLVPVQRPYGLNKSNVVVGVIKSFTAKYPEGMTRVMILGDPSRGMGSLAEAECRRINAALDLAQKMDVPLEWIALSAGARISMDSGVENMDWIALVLRKLIEYTQAGNEVNVVVVGINVGAQPYWNAEATMLMHTRGILIMTAEGAMVLTGKMALDYSGGVSAEDNLGIGGYERIMGPNGQAQYFARDVHEALQILLRYYEHSYREPGERFPRRAATSDPIDRDVRSFPHGRAEGYGFATVGDVFSNEKNPGRKKPFDIRRVMHSVVDQDHDPLERWFGMRDAEVAVVWDACLGGYPVCLLGLESRPLPRLGSVPADGPVVWTAGTLFPQASKKVARTVNSVSGNRPLVILANLSGFDGSPESMRAVQLEFGAEIGRAVVNFKGPIVFAVVSRYHGGAFVVFSNKLNENMEVAALEGTYASVIGGAPAAAVVFAREVKKRTQSDPRVRELDEAVAKAKGAEKVRLRAQLVDVTKNVHSERLGQVAEEFDGIHSVHRALKMGSVHHIIPPARLRPWLIDAVERGIERDLTGKTFLEPPW